MHFGTKQTLNSKHSGEIENDRKMIRHSHRARTMIKDRARATGAFLLSAALVMGLVPVIAPDEVMPETQAAQVAQVTSFEGMSHDEVSAAMSTMTVDEIVDAMSLHEKICQMFVVYPQQINNNSNSESGTATSLSSSGRTNLSNYPWGGVCYFTANIPTTVSAALSYSNDLKNTNKYPMFIAVDEEGGLVQRIGGPTGSYTFSKPGFTSQTRTGIGRGIGTQVGSMYTYAGQGEQVAYNNAVALAENCKMIGANWDFAPVADTDSVSGNAIAKLGRTYSNDISEGKTLIASAVKGFKDANVGSSLKHFPGHGAGLGDTHDGGVPISKTMAQMEQEDLTVFQAGIDAGADSIMLGHLVLSEFDSAAVPVSSKWFDYIRNTMGFDGVVTTDGMKMGALTSLYGSTQTGYVNAAVDCVKAGMDVLLLCGAPITAVSTLESKVNSGEIQESRIDESVKRIMTMKRNRGIIPPLSQASYTPASGEVQYGSLAEMWSKASAEGNGTIKLLDDINADENGSFGTGTNIDSNGTFTLSGKKVTLDLNGHVLNKNLSDKSVQANKHIFKIANGGNLTVIDTTDGDEGNITGGNATIGSVAYVTGSQSKFIIDSGTISGNKSSGAEKSSIIYSENDGTILRFGNNAGTNEKVTISGNDATSVIYLQDQIYIMAPLTIKDNGGHNLYLAPGAKVRIQSPGLTAGINSVGISASQEYLAQKQLAADVDTSSHDINQDLTALFSDNENYALAINGNTIVFEEIAGDARFAPQDGSASSTGDFGDMVALANQKAGTITLLKDININSTQTATATEPLYGFNHDTVINLNGRSLTVTSNKKSLFGLTSANTSLTITDANKAVETKEPTSSHKVASFGKDTWSLSYDVDELDNGELKSYRVTSDLSTVGRIDWTSTNADPNGIIDSGDGKTGTSVNIGNGVFTSNETSRALVVRANSKGNISGGYFVKCASAAHSSTIWSFGSGAQTTISDGVFVLNTSKASGTGSTIASAGVAGAYSTGSLSVTGGIFTSNTSNSNGGAITTGVPAANWNNTATNANNNAHITLTGGTFCYNTAAKDGGAIYVNSTSTTDISNVLISHNSATNGGGIYMNGNSKVNLSGDVAIMANTATTAAGGVYNAVSEALSIKDNIIAKDNTANGFKSDIALLSNENKKVVVTGQLTSLSRSIGIDLPTAEQGNIFAKGNGYTVTGNDAGKFFIDSDETLFGSLDGNNNIILEQGEAQYLSPDGEVKSGDFKELWTTYFSAGTNGKITLMKDVSLSMSSQSDILISKSPNAELDLNGHILSITKGATDNAAPIEVQSGKLTINDSTGRVSSSSSVVDTTSGRTATYDAATKTLTYYVTTHENNGIQTREIKDVFDNYGAIDYSTSASDGAGIVQIDADAECMLVKGRLTSPYTRAIQNNNGKFTMTGGYIVGCQSMKSAPAIGGAVLNLNTTVNMMSGGVVAGNRGNNGGAFWLRNGNVQSFTMSGGIISGNTASGQGGAIWAGATSAAKVTINGGTITNNVASGNGGAICYLPTSRAANKGIDISHASITANKTTAANSYGGGIYSAYSGNLTVTDSHVDANETAGNGGGVYSATGLIADTLCVSENKAGVKSGGVFVNLNTNMKGKMTIVDNTANGKCSNLDVYDNGNTDVAADKTRITSALSIGSRIGLTINKNGNNQKVVSSSISLDMSYDKMFFDDANESHVLHFNDGAGDAMWLIDENDDNLGTQPAGGGMTTTGSITNITAKNTADNNGLSIAIFTGNGTSTIQQLSSLNSSHRYWYHYKFSPEVHNGQTYYKLNEIVPNNGVDSTHNYVLKSGEIAIIAHGAGELKGILPVTVGQYIKLDFDAFAGPAHMAYKSNVGKFEVFNYDEGPAEVEYKIHHIYWYPSSIDYGTNVHYTQFKEESGLSGNVGSLQYVPYNVTNADGIMSEDENHCIAKVLKDNAVTGGNNWYYSSLENDIPGTNPDSGASDSVNDLYVIYEHVDDVYTYSVEYYDADTGELLKKDEGLTSPVLPSATTSMKTLYEYEYDADNPNNVETIQSASDEMVLKLYFKKWPTYSIEYYDADTREQFDASIIETYVSKPVDPKSETPIAIDTLPDSLKTIEGYDYVETDETVDRIESVAQDGSSKLKLYFEKILYRPYSIEYYDKDTGGLVGTLEKTSVKAGTKVILPAINEEYAIPSENVKYRIVPGDVRNVTEITVPRSGDVPPMKVYSEKVNTTRIHIQRYEYDGSKWTTMGLPVIIDCDSNTEFNVLTAENKTKYVDGISGYIFLPNDPKNVTQVHVGGITDPTPVVKLHYAKTEELTSGTGVQKTPNDNGLVPIERASTKDFIKIELFDYGRSINDRATSTGSYPIFKGYPISGTASNAWQLGNIGETVQYDAATATAGDKLGYNKTTSGLINRLTASSVDNNRAQGANAAVNGFTYDYVGGRKTTPGKNPMSNVLGADGLPVLADGTSLSYLFTDSNDVSATDPNDFTVKKIASGIDGLFDYNPDTGYYSYSSSKNHAEYNAETNKFDVYDQIITPNLSDYSFGNFLPFTKINDKATKSVKVNQEYIQQVAKYARYKYNNETDTDLKNRYKSVADSLESIDKLMVNQYGSGYDYNDVLNVYYRGQNGNVVPNNVTNPQDCFTNPITGEKYFESFEDFYNKLYMIDYDEIKNFFFGITFELDFVQPQEGQIGSDRRNMVFDFEGDDDVLIYIDGKLFLNLAGIHRQVGGQIDFTQGIIKYEDFNYNAGVTMQASYPTQAGYSRLDEGIVTFREALTAAGMSQSEIDSMLNEQGTFKDWTSHNFKMFYMERGSGSGVMRLNFNLPLIPNNSVLVAKNITNENEEYQPILSDPFFNMQFVKCDDDGQPITYATGEKKGKAVPYLEEGTPYMIYENGAYTGRTRYVDENGMVSLRANQFAVITDVAKPGDKYLVRELIPKEFAEQFDKTVVTNNSVFGVGDYQQPDVTHEVSSDPENGEWYPNEDGVMTNYMVRASYPMAPDGVNLSSTLFENNLNSMMLGAVAISKDIIEGDHTWSDNDEFNIAVAFDGKPLSATTSANTPSTYYVYTKDENGQFEIQGDGETRRVPADGIITIKANEVAVLRYMLAGSTFEAYEIDNSGTGNYHPIYMRDPETGENVYSGKVTVGSKDDPVRFNITNQRADNLEISKVVENMPADGTDMDYTFEVSIAADDRHIDDTYEYEVFAIDDEIDSTTMRELTDRDTAVSLYQEYLATGASLDMGQVKPNRSTVTFKDGKASLSLKANQKVIIYGLPYQCNYTVTETSASDEYQAFYKGTNMNEFTNGTVATFVLDSKSTDTGSATTVEFKNRKIEDLSVSKKVEIGVIDSLLGKYESDFQTKFKFSISDASYQGEPLSGDYEADIVDSYNKTDGQDTVTSTTVTFDNGQALFELSHGQTLTVRGLPYGALYTVSEEGNPAYDTSYKIGTDNILEQAFEGTSTPQQSIASNNHVYFSNSLIMSSLPTTGGIGLIVIAMALIGGMIFLSANMRRRRLLGGSAPDNEGTSGDNTAA